MIDLIWSRRVYAQLRETAWIRAKLHQTCECACETIQLDGMRCELENRAIEDERKTVRINVISREFRSSFRVKPCDTARICTKIAGKSRETARDRVNCTTHRAKSCKSGISTYPCKTLWSRVIRRKTARNYTKPYESAGESYKAIRSGTISSKSCLIRVYTNHVGE